MQKRKLLYVCSFAMISYHGSIYGEAEMREFVNLSDVAPDIIISPRYSTAENFVGVPIDGYKVPKILLTRQAAQALKNVQDHVKKDGYSLVAYDGYRPQKATNHFVRWAVDLNDQSKKKQYYPRVNKADVFELDYVSKRSGHSRGSTVDVTLIKLGESLYPIKERTRVLGDGFTIVLLDDGTLDMGSPFDLFDGASHYEDNLIPAECRERRRYLRRVMEAHGFQGIPSEWWHFTLNQEPFNKNHQESYFDFDVK